MRLMKERNVRRGQASEEEEHAKRREARYERGTPGVRGISR